MKPAALLVLLLSLTGCWAPLYVEGIPARELPDHYRMPLRTLGVPLNYSQLTALTNDDQRLGSGDKLSVTIPGLLGNQGQVLPTIQVQVTDTGEVFLPLVGPVDVGGLDLAEAQRKINDAYMQQHLNDARVTAVLEERGSTTLCVLGSVMQPGIYTLPRSNCDVAHALAAAGGLNPDAADVIEVHRRQAPLLKGERFLPKPAEDADGVPENISWRSPLPVLGSDPPSEVKSVRNTARRHTEFVDSTGHSPPPTAMWMDMTGSQGIIRIPLRGLETRPVLPEEIALGPNDVVVVPKKPREVFYVVGKLDATSRARFAIGDREREIGSGFLLPPDREIDVVTAVAMAGYIDPIDSPTTVTVHRQCPHGQPMLILVDLLRARHDAAENVLVQPNDIVYLNPDAPWYFRRTVDQIISRALGVAIGRAITN